MKKTILRLAGASLCLAMALSGCGGAAAQSEAASSTASSEAPAASALTAAFKASDQYDYQNFTDSMNIDENGLWQGITASDYVTLPEGYDAITIPEAEVTPSDSDIEAGVNRIVEQYAAAAEGDTVNIDYVGTVNGVEFVGGNTQGSGYNLVLGSNTFISGFEEQVEGHKVGDEFDVNVTFPEGYQSTTDTDGNAIELSGAAAVFHVRINAITYGWQLADDWVAANLNADPYNVATVADLKTYVSDRQLRTNEENYVVDYLVQNSTFADPLPEPVMDYMVTKYLNYYNSLAAYYGVSLSTYFAEVPAHYASIDAALADHEDTITAAVKSSLVQQAVAEAAGLTVTDEDRAQYESYVDTYGANYVAQFALDRQVKNYMLKGVTVG